MAGSGNKVVVFNTRERVLSTDQNRKQAFAGADAATTLARSLLARYPLDQGISDLPETVGTPPRALVLDGLMLRPIDGSASALVDPGSVALVDPDPSPSPDDAPFKYVHSEGVQSVGELVLTPNPGGVRIDVVEFRRVVEDLDGESRDIFDPVTGLFSPSIVIKSRRGALEFRIRLGVVGSSFPGVAEGWVPIAVVRVPSVAATWDDVTIWDVRPLLADRVLGGAPRVEGEPPRVTRQLLRTDLAQLVASVGADVRVSGRVEAELLGWRVGGKLETSAPGTQTGYVDVAKIENQEGSGVTFDPGTCWYLYALFPYGLPRWTRYSAPGVGGRVPNGTKGMLVVSKKPPRFSGRPSAVIYPPNGTDVQNGTYALGTNPAVCVAAGVTDQNVPAQPLGVTVDGRVTRAVASDYPGLAPASQTASESRFEPIAGTHYPDNARALYALVTARVEATGNVFNTFIQSLRITDASGSLVSGVALFQSLVSTMTFTLSSGGVSLVYFEARLPLDPSLNEGSARSFKIYWTYNAVPAGMTLNDVAMFFSGWELGD